MHEEEWGNKKGMRKLMPREEKASIKHVVAYARRHRAVWYGKVMVCRKESLVQSTPF